MSLRRGDLKRGNFGFVRRILPTVMSSLGCELRLVKTFIGNFSVDFRNILSVDGAKSWNEIYESLLIVLERGYLGPLNVNMR